VYHSAAVAATLDLPLNNNLGFGYIVPYNQKQSDGTWRQVAQFQMGYKGFIQLAQRTGQFKTVNATDVRAGEIKKLNRLSGEIEFAWIEEPEERLKTPVVGYVAYFQLLNGFDKSMYMTIEQLKAHGVKYSQTFKKGHGLWKDEFETMCIKTVIKLLLAKYAPLSIEMQKAVIADQSVINNSETMDVTYADNEEPVIDKEAERITLMIQDAKTVEELKAIEPHVQEPQLDLFVAKMDELKK